jgi:predicted amidohydrolase YtcJ
VIEDGHPPTVTHRYTLLIRGTVISGRDEPDVTAIAWAADTVIALGSDDEVRGTSRGDSHVIDLGGASVVALGEGPDACWPPDATLEVGGRADLAVLTSDPRLVDSQAQHRLPALALVRAGRVVAGRLPGRPRPRATTEGASG